MFTGCWRRKYREGDYNEKVFTKGDGNALPATPEEIIALAKRKYGVDNETMIRVLFICHGTTQ